MFRSLEILGEIAVVYNVSRDRSMAVKIPQPADVSFVFSQEFFIDRFFIV